MRQSFAQGGREGGGGQRFRSGAQDRFAETIDIVCGFFECCCLGIARCAEHDYLEGVARVQQRGEPIRCGEQSVLRDQAYEGFERFFGPVAVEFFAGQAIQTVERDDRDGIGAGRGRILQRLAANFHAAHRRGILGAIEKAAAFGVAVTLHGEAHGAFSDFEITAVERRFVGIEQGNDHKNLIVERAIEARAADAMQEPFRIFPGFGEDAVESFQCEGAAIVAAQNSGGFEIGGDEHGVPGDVDSGVDRRDWGPQAPRGEHLAFCGGQQLARIRFADF